MSSLACTEHCITTPIQVDLVKLASVSGIDLRQILLDILLDVYVAAEQTGLEVSSRMHDPSS